MRKMYLAITAFAALLISQIGYAIPVVPGATDIATADGDTFYALMERDGGWYVDGYDANGNSTGFSTQLGAASGHDQWINPDLQDYVGLAFDGTTFYGLRDDLASATENSDTYSVIGFGLDGGFNGDASILNDGLFVTPSLQELVAFSINNTGTGDFFALRDDSQSYTEGYADTWTQVGFSYEDSNWNGLALTLDENPSTTPFAVQVSWNPTQEGTNVASVPEPATGLLLGSMFALGLLGRRKIKAA